LFVSKNDNITVAHYTSKNVAQKLLFDKNAKFRLNMAVHSNDPKEGITLCDYLHLRLKYDDAEEYGAFIGCFSFNKDSLNQFRLYGKDKGIEGTGVSIIFNSSCFNKNPQTPSNSTNKCIPLYRCIYLDSETDRVVSVVVIRKNIFIPKNILIIMFPLIQII
jgi:hypothetical protein